MLTTALEEAIASYGTRPINSRYFHGDQRLPLRSEHYRFRAGHVASEGGRLPEGILFNRDFTSYFLVLQALRDGTHVDAAVLGFNVEGTIADCLQIQGGHDRFKELTPVRWDRALLAALLELSEKSELTQVQVVPAICVHGHTWQNAERLEKRYDQNAVYHHFRYDREISRWVRTPR